jgi:hypothetical protein
MAYVIQDPKCNCCNNSAFILPLKFYPVRGKTKRKLGFGCSSCVHKPYCQDFYWLRRNFEYTLSPDFGTSCASWSDNKEDYIHGATCGDLQTIDRWQNMGIMAEKDENGLGDLN